MKRSPFIRKPPKKKRPLGAKPDTRSKVKKIWKSREHLDRVKMAGCLLHGKGYGWCEGPMDPHHCRKLRPGGLTARHDSLAIPLCRKHHRMMDGDERKLWRTLGIDPARWISEFSPEGKAAIEALRHESEHQ